MNKLHFACALTLCAGFIGAGAMAHAATPLRCGQGDAAQIRGDAPAAISYDVYSQLHPLSAQRLALFEQAGTVTRLPDGMPVCQIADDGVDDPSAALVRAPQGTMAWWVNADSVETAD